MVINKVMSWIWRTFEIAHSSHQSIRSMEGIRGFAVFLVFLVHYVTLVEPWMEQDSATFQIASYIRNIGNSGVDLFFVLSGYLIYGTLIKKRSFFPVYMARRVRRIYPTFAAVLFIYILLSFIFPAESKLPDDWQDKLVYIIQNLIFLPGMFHIEPIITVAWSLSYEVFYYLLIPVLISVFAMRVWLPVYRAIFFGVLSLLLFIYFFHNEGPIRLLMFISGILLYETISSDRIKRILPLGLFALALSAVAMVVFQALGFDDRYRIAALYVLFFIFCLECLVSPGVTNRLFSWSPLRWLGNMSYSYYLIHGLALKAVFLLLAMAYPATANGIWVFWFLLFPMFLSTLIPSTILFIAVEKPYSLVRKP